MSDSAERPPTVAYLPIAVLLAYSAWAVWSAFRHGVLAWGALADYSPYPYILVLGMLCSAYVCSQSSLSRAVDVRGAFLLVVLGFGMALDSLEPMRAVPANMRWAFDFAALVAGFSVLAAGIVLEKQVRRRQ